MPHFLFAHAGFHDAFLHFLTEPDHLAFITVAVGVGFYLWRKKHHENR